MPRIPITDLGGSINQGRPPSEIGANEYASLANFYQFGSKLIRRGGIRLLASPPAGLTDGIYGMLAYRPATLPPGGVDMIVAGRTEIGIQVGASIAVIPRQNFSIPTSTRRWTLFQYKDILYGIREGVGLLRSDGTYVGASGIAAPAAAPTIVDGAAGDIPAANFVAVYTFYNANTGMESNPSPASAVLAHAGGKKINWSGIAVSTNIQVTSRRLYRSLPDQTGEYFLVAEIPNNVDTTYVGDNVLAQDLDDAVSQVNGVPPAGLLFGTVWKERLFASDGVNVFHSEDGLIEAFNPAAVIPAYPDDGHPIRALHAFGDRLMIGKTNAIHYLVGSDPSNFALLTLTDRHGCVAHHSMRSAEGHLFWLGMDNVYRSDGNSVTGIASVKLKSTLQAITASAARDSVATVYPQLGWYVLMIPGYVTLIYNYRTDAWTIVGFTQFELFTYIADYFDSNYQQQLYVANDAGRVFRFNDTTYGYDDFVFLGSLTQANILASFLSRAFGAEASTKHVVERASLLCTRYAENITLEIVSEGTTVKSRSVSLDYDPRWKLYNLSTRHRATSQSQLRVTYTGRSAIELEGYALDISPLGRPSMVAR